MAKRDWSLHHYSSPTELRANVRSACVKRVQDRFDVVWSDALERGLIRYISDPDPEPGAVLRDLGTAAARIRDLARQGRWPFDLQGVALYSGDPLMYPSHARFMVLAPAVEELIPVVPCAPDGTALGLGCGLLVASACEVPPVTPDSTPIRSRYFVKASAFGTRQPAAAIPTVARQRLVNGVKRGLLCGRGPLRCPEAFGESRPATVVDGRAQCFYCPNSYDANLEACPECGAPRGMEKACCSGRCARLATNCEIAHVFLLLQGEGYFEKKLSDGNGESHVQYVLDTECDSIKSARLDLNRPKVSRKRRRSA